MSGTTQHSNLAARMGRWSANHWKTATFGWLALVVVAFALGGAVGTKNVDPNTAGPGESGRMDRVLAAGFKLPADESVLIQSRSARAGAPAFDSAVKDVVARVSEAGGRAERPLAADPPRRSRGRHAALVEFEIRGDKDKAGDKIGPVLDSVDAAQRAHPGLLHRRVRRRQRGEGRRHGVCQRPQERGHALDPAHADHPRRRVRRARRRGHSAAARPDRGLRDVRAGRAAQSPAADRAGGVRGRAADRARGRRRLLDVLPARASARSVPPAGASAPRSRPPPRLRAVRCSSPA